MALGGIWDVEWLNQNSQRRYPLFEGASAVDVTGTFTLPDSFLVDFMWSLHEGSSDPTLFHVSSVTVFSDSVILSMGYNGVTVATISVSKSTHTRYQAYTAIGSGVDFYDSLLRFTVGTLDDILAQPNGTWTFSAVTGRLQPTVLRPSVRGVSGLVLIASVGAATLTDPIQNEVELAAGSNIRLTMTTQPNGRKRIRIDAISGEGLNEPCECGNARIAVPIRRINGIPGDSAGNFTLQGDECIELTSIDAGLAIRDTCCTPCCGCDELQVISDALQTLENRVAGVENIATRMDSVIQQMQNVILVSKLGTVGTCP